MGTCTLIITRKKQFVASLASYNVTIDGVDYGTIKNGSNLQCSLSDGVHEITFKWMKKISTFSFCIPSDMGTVNMSMEFNKMTGNLILFSKDIKVDNCSYNFDHIIELPTCRRGVSFRTEERTTHHRGEAHQYRYRIDSRRSQPFPYLPRR